MLPEKLNSKIIFVVGGVISSVGKGIVSSSLGRLLKNHGYPVSILKCEMYINIDAGTIRPTEHGEIFVTDDGIETDQDIGNYERFLDINMSRVNFITTGQIYQEVIKRERNLEYDGEDVEVVPHIPLEIIRRIQLAAQSPKADITLVEIGGTIGEYQNVLFLEAARMLKLKFPKDVVCVLVSYLPVPKTAGEMKTKPTQLASRLLNETGIQADFIVCRGEHLLDQKRKEKIALLCNMNAEDVISAPDEESIYTVPLQLESEQLDEKILKKLGLDSMKKNMNQWKTLTQKINNIDTTVKIGMIGKYFATGNYTLTDSYISVIEAVKHACWHLGYKPEFVWINSENIEKNPSTIAELKNMDGIIIPQGWGSRGIEGKIAAIKYSRENKLPYLGLCFGMQMAVIEFARNVCKLSNANTEEAGPTPHPVIHIMPHQKEYLERHQYGGTIRLGSYPCVLKQGTTTHKAYSKITEQSEAKTNIIINERHRHRYEFNNEYRQKMEDHGLVISGTSPDGLLVEAVELKDHPFFVGVQFHPEYKSTFMNPHPLFIEFIRQASKQEIM